MHSHMMDSSAGSVMLVLLLGEEEYADLLEERIGVLHDHFLGRNHPLGEARLLWEIGAQGASVRSLRRRLGLDSAYISRLLRSLEGQGLIVVGTSENDGRVRQVQLTEAGLRERAELDQRADAFARSLLEPLSESQRVKLVAAMAEVERILIASMVKIAVARTLQVRSSACGSLHERVVLGWDGGS